MYIEVYIAVNFIMNLLMLRLAAALCSCRVSPLRLCAGAALGAIYAAASLYLPSLVWPPIKLASGALIACTLPFSGLRSYIMRVSAVFLSAFVTGGLAVCTAYIAGSGLDGPVPLAAAAVTAVGALLLPRMARRLAARPRAGRGELVLVCGGREYRVPAMVDTGSALTEPLSGRPVTIAPIEELRELCVIPVPAQTVAGGVMLYAFCPESVEFIDKKRMRLDSLVAVSTMPAVKTAIIPIAALPA